MKIALLLVSLGENYHQFIDPLIISARKHFLKNHQVDFILFTDSKNKHDAIIFPEENIGFPFATHLRYHIFLRQEEKLKEYDYVFYSDIDMLFVDDVNIEILGEGLTAVQHPGYAFKPLEQMEVNEKMWFYPFERNPQSTAYFRKPEYYFAGGFQGGRTEPFIKAMWEMKRNIDADFDINYISRWHDESHWNCYLWHNPPAVILSPSYCFPVNYPTPEKPPYETLPIYKRIWGKDYPPKLLCLTKSFSLSKSGGEAINKIFNDRNET